MPLNLRARIKRLMNEQSEEAAQPTSYAILKSTGEDQEEIDPPGEQEGDVPEALDVAPPDSPPEPEGPATESEEVEPPEAEPIPEPDPPEAVPPPEDFPEMGDVPEQENGSFQEMDVPEDEDGQQQPEQPDWESMLGYVGQQGNDQLFDGLAIRMAESTHRQLNRFQDKFERHMAELDIGNSY
jgi:hypothetical protein